MYATDLAVDMARQGVPFREAYRQAADPSRWAEGDPEASLAARVSPGASGAPGPGCAAAASGGAGLMDGMPSANRRCPNGGGRC